MQKILCVGKGFIGTALSRYKEFDVIHHKDFTPVLLKNYASCINTSGIIGYAKCKQASKESVYSANANYALYMKAACQASNTIFFQPSTTGMYMPQVCCNLDDFVKPNEKAPTRPYNLSLIHI